MEYHQLRKSRTRNTILPASPIRHQDSLNTSFPNIFQNIKTESNHNSNLQLFKLTSETKPYDLVGNKQQLLNYLKRIDSNPKSKSQLIKKMMESRKSLMSKNDEIKSRIFNTSIKGEGFYKKKEKQNQMLELESEGGNKNVESRRKQRKIKIEQRFQGVLEEKSKQLHSFWKSSLKESELALNGRKNHNKTRYSVWKLDKRKSFPKSPSLYLHKNRIINNPRA